MEISFSGFFVELYFYTVVRVADTYMYNSLLIVLFNLLNLRYNYVNYSFIKHFSFC